MRFTFFLSFFFLWADQGVPNLQVMEPGSTAGGELHLFASATVFSITALAPPPVSGIISIMCLNHPETISLGHIC